MLQNDGGAAAADVHTGGATGLRMPGRERARGYLARFAGLSADDRRALGIWAAAHLALLALAWAAAWAFRSTREHAPLTGAFEHWDAVLLRNIAQYGYFGPHTIPNNVVFFPGYPAVLSAGHLLLRNWVLTELTVSAVAGCFAVVGLARLAGGSASVLYLLSAPAAIFLMVGYSEALFLALAIPAWLAAAQGRWWRAALLAALAGFVRPDGVFLIAALVVMALTGYRGPGTWPTAPARIGGRLANAAKVATALAGPALYEIYLWAATGNALAWSAANRQGWGLRLSTPSQDFRTTWWAAFQHPFAAGTAFEFQLELVAMAVMVVALLAFLFAGQAPEATYCGLALIAFATSTWLQTGQRTVLVLFPIWVGLAALGQRRPWTRYAYFGLSAPLAVVVGFMYLSGQWAG